MTSKEKTLQDINEQWRFNDQKYLRVFLTGFLNARAKTIDHRKSRKKAPQF